MYLSLILFFLYTWGLGFTLLKLLKEPENFFERNIIRVGAGLCLIPLLGIVLSILSIPVDWRLFAVISLIGPFYFLIRNYKVIKGSIAGIKLKKSDLSLFLVLLVALASFFMYYKGAFSYPYLEDDDSWSHAVGAKYVSSEKTFFNPNGGIHYLDPYPPAYDGTFGLLHQSSGSVYWTLKFFNALVISLSILFFYLFFKELTSSSVISAFSTIVLAMIPSYLSHFIWAHSFIPGFIFLSFLFLEKIKHDKRWIFAASVSISALILTSFTQAIKFYMLLMIYFSVKSVADKRFHLETISAGILGFLLSLVWWIPLVFRYGGMFNLLEALGAKQSRATIPLDYFSSTYLYAAAIILLALAFAYYFLKKKLSPPQVHYAGVAAAIFASAAYAVLYSFVNESGTADRIYDFNDFFIAQKQNMVNNPIGIGTAAFLLCFAALLLIGLELYGILKQKKGAISRPVYNSLLALAVASSISLFISAISFSFFKLDKNIIAKWGVPAIKQWMLRDADKYNYIYSFSFKIWGVYLLIASLILIAAIYLYFVYKEYIQNQKLWVPLSLLWLAYAFAGIYDIPTQLFTFRIWMIVAFAVSMLAAYPILMLQSLGSRLKILKAAVVVLLVTLIFYTSGIQKYAVNTSPNWPAGGFWTSFDEINGYVWMRDNIAQDTNVFTFANSGAVIGMDMHICHWCREVADYQKNGFNQTAEENYNWLKSNKYRYILIDGQTARKFGINQTTIKLQSMSKSGMFKPVHQTNGFILLGLS